jgi:3-methyladenine DNA glycosylase/8-oxoguanine DNA glycosylase
MKTKSGLVCHTLQESTPLPFDFESTATAHGWVMLRPFEWHRATAELRRIHRLNSGNVIRLRLKEGNSRASSTVQVTVETVAALTPIEEAEVSRIVRRMLRLDEDFNEFYQLGSQLNGWELRLRPGSGRLLRCPTLFEDIIYTLCTTNITWSGTIRMVDQLTAQLGEPLADLPEWRAFPTPEAIAAAGTDKLKQVIGLGYRSTYVWELAMAIAEGRLDLQSFEDPTLSTEALYESLRQIKGVGPYAAATLLMILGRYEYLAIDTELRTFVSKKYFAGQPASDTQIRSIYDPWGRWQYLAYWFDTPL